MNTKVKQQRARLSQPQFFRVCSYLQGHPDLKNSSNDTIRSLTKIEFSDMVLSDKTLDTVRKTLGPDWVLTAPKRAYTRKQKGAMNDVYSKAILQAVLGLYTHLGVTPPADAVALAGNNVVYMDDAA